MQHQAKSMFADESHRSESVWVTSQMRAWSGFQDTERKLPGHPGFAGSNRKCVLQDSRVERSNECLQWFSSFLLLLLWWLACQQTHLSPVLLISKLTFCYHLDLWRMGWDLQLQTTKKFISLMKYPLFWQKALELLVKTNLRVLTVQMPCFREILDMQTLSLICNDSELLRGEGDKRTFC